MLKFLKGIGWHTNEYINQPGRFQEPTKKDNKILVLPDFLICLIPESYRIT